MSEAAKNDVLRHPEHGEQPQVSLGEVRAESQPPGGNRAAGLKRWLPLVKLAVSSALIVWVYSRVELGALGAVLADVVVPILAVIYGVMFFNTVISAQKWRILLHADGIDLPLRSLVTTYLVGTFFNVFMPSSVGGDVYRVYHLSRRGAGVGSVFASVFADRVSGLIALAFLGLVFALVSYTMLPTHSVLLLPLITFIGLVTVLWLVVQRRALLFLMQRTRLDRVARLAGFVGAFLDSIAVYRKNGPVVMRALLVSVAFQLGVVVAVYLMGRALRLDVPFLYFCAFVPLISLIESVPISIYGLGVRDAAYVTFFAYVGVPEVHALSLALLYLLLSLGYAALGGVLFALRPRSMEPQVTIEVAGGREPPADASG